MHVTVSWVGWAAAGLAGWGRGQNLGPTQGSRCPVGPPQPSSCMPEGTGRRQCSSTPACAHACALCLYVLMPSTARPAPCRPRLPPAQSAAPCATCGPAALRSPTTRSTTSRCWTGPWSRWACQPPVDHLPSEGSGMGSCSLCLPLSAPVQSNVHTVLPGRCARRYSGAAPRWRPAASRPPPS